MNYPIPGMGAVHITSEANSVMLHVIYCKQYL